MNKWLVFLLLGFSITLNASEAVVQLQGVTTNINDKASLQRGAGLFMNYCSGCHSLKYIRYERIGKDLGLTDFDGRLESDLLYNNLIFTESKIYDPVRIAMPENAARQWFGIVPPDLSLTARKRGADWIYTYLNSFYADPSRPFGSNNLLVPAVAMPNILAPLQGQVIAVKEKQSGNKEKISHLLLLEPGRMNRFEFENSLLDIVNFLSYVAEPAKLERVKIGPWVILFLLIFLIPVYLLKKSYWKKINH